MIVREIPQEQRKLAALKVIAWGFPRRVTWAEWSDGVWITDEPQTGIAWLSKWIEEGHWVLHAQLAPRDANGWSSAPGALNLGALDASGKPTPEFERWRRSVRLPTREVLAAIRVTAGLLGAKRVYAALGSARPGWQRVLLRSGLFEKQDECGPYMDLEGG